MFLTWIALFISFCYVAGQASVSVIPDTYFNGAQASSWTFTVVNLDPVAPGDYRSFYISTSTAAFLTRPANTPDLSIAGCTAEVTNTFTTSVFFMLNSGCGYGGTFSFTLPGDYLMANPAGNVSVQLSLGTNSLRTFIVFTNFTVSPKASASPSPSPVSASPSASPAASPLQMSVSVTPDTIQNGAQATFWTITVVNLGAVAPGDDFIFYISSTPSAFRSRPANTPDLSVAGCTATVTSTMASVLYFSLGSSCGYGGTFSFTLPGDYLAVNPAGNVSVTLSIGASLLRTVIPFTNDTVSPRASPSISPSPVSPGPSASPAPSPLPKFVSVTPDTIDNGAQAAYWDVTVVNLDAVAPGDDPIFYISASKSTFLRRPANTPVLSVAGCTATVTSTLATVIYFSMGSGCGYGGTFSFRLPGDYLAPNPGGNVSVTVSIGSDMLRTVIFYTPDSPSPLASTSRSPSPASPVSPSPSPAASPSPRPSQSPGAVSVSVTPDTIQNGAQPASWIITVVNLATVAPGSNPIFYISATPSAFRSRPANAPDLSVAGCTATVTSTLASVLYFSLGSSCGYGGTFSFTLPGDYLAVNPAGNVSVTLSIGASLLRTVIPFTDVPVSPKASPSVSASPVSPSPIPSPAASPLPMFVYVTPDTVDSGAQAAFWNVTVVNLAAVAPGDNPVFYISASKSTFVRRPANTPVLGVGRCTATVTTTLTTVLYFTLGSGCAYGGTFSFLLPGDYLAPNPGGDVAVTLSMGASTLRTVVLFTADSPSPTSPISPSPIPSASPRPSPRPSPAAQPPSGNPDSSNSDNKTNTLLTILVGAVLGLLALLAIVVAAVAWCYVRRQRRKTVWGEYRVAEPVKAAAADDVWGAAAFKDFPSLGFAATTLKASPRPSSPPPSIL